MATHAATPRPSGTPSAACCSKSASPAPWSPTTPNATATGTLIDGLLRKQDFDLDWPTLILDVTDAEADLLLATHDPLGALAEYDRTKLQALVQEVRAKSPAVVAMLKDLARKAGASQKEKAGEAVRPPQGPRAEGPPQHRHAGRHQQRVPADGQLRVRRAGAGEGQLK